jgi:hypothetical protein
MMNELDNLKKLWQEQEQKLEQSMALNLSLLKETKLDKAQNQLVSLIWMSSLTAAFYIAALWYFVFFAFHNLDNWHFVLAGGILTVWSGAIALGSILQLKSILTLDYAKPVAELQKQLQEIKFTIIRFLRLALMIIPFYLVFLEVIFQVMFNVDFVALMDPLWVILQPVVLLPIVIWLYIKLSPKNAEKKWMNWLLQGNGSQIKSAQNFIQEINQLQTDVQ